MLAVIQQTVALLLLASREVRVCLRSRREGETVPVHNSSCIKTESGFEQEGTPLTEEERRELSRTNFFNRQRYARSHVRFGGGPVFVDRASVQSRPILDLFGPTNNLVHAFIYEGVRPRHQVTPQVLRCSKIALYHNIKDEVRLRLVLGWYGAASGFQRPALNDSSRAFYCIKTKPSHKESRAIGYLSGKVSTRALHAQCLS